MMAEWSYPKESEGMTYQEEQAWAKACEALAELNGTLSLRFESAGSRREFEIIYIPLPTKEET
jgi:hypothetical protein